MNALASNTKPIILGENVADIEACARAVAQLACVYRSTPNFPDCQDLKASRFKAYQEALADFMENVRNG